MCAEINKLEIIFRIKPDINFFHCLCSPQVYQVSTGKFTCRNKYYGRKLGVEGFREGLCQFLHNGNRLRSDALIPLVEKLQELKSVLSSLDTFRFYTSSLLLIYEGLDPELSYDEETLGEGIPPTPQIPMDTLDDPLSAHPSPVTTNTPAFPKLSKSTENFVRAKSQDEVGLVKNGSISTEALSEPTGGAMGGGMTTPSSSGKSSRSNLTLASRGSTPSATSLSSESVDVRLIDFAHATHSGLDLGHCAKEHAGADAGFIFGLSNLIKVLQEIIDEECT